MPRSVTMLTAVFLATGQSFGADWPQWRGPNQDGVSAEADWSIDWDAGGPPRLWEFELGAGHGAVAVAGDRLYTIGTTGEARDTDTVYCLDTKTGKAIWQNAYARVERVKRTATVRGGTNTTPTSDQGKVYTYSGDAQLYCFDAADGEVLWRRELMKELDAEHPQYDHNSSPVIVGDLVIVLARLPDASIIAFDKQTGKEAWRAHHKTRRGALGGFWSTPVCRRIDGKPCLVYLPGLSVVGLDPATGATHWKYDFVEQGIDKAEQGAVAASPVVVGDRVFFPFHPDHDRGFSACIEITRGQPKLLWKSLDLAHWWHSPVVWNDCVIALDQGPAAVGSKSGALYCYHLATGRLMWKTYDIGGASRGDADQGGEDDDRRRPLDSAERLWQRDGCTAR